MRPTPEVGVPPMVPVVRASSLARSAWIPRPRLLEALHSSVGHGLMVIEAPAGFGKSNLVAQFAAEVDFAVRPLVLDSACEMPEVLARRLASALVGRQTRAPAGTSLTDLKAHVSSALHEAVSASSAPLLIILDNVQLAGPHEDSLELVRWLIGIVPEGTEILVSGRRVDAGRLRASADDGPPRVIVGRDDLTFTVDEVAALARLRHVQVDPEDVWQRTRGWPVAVAAALSGAAVGAPGQLAPGDESWHQYLTRELWGQVPLRMQTLLERASVPSEIDGRLGAHLFGRTRWAEIREHVAGSELLADPLARRGTVRLNPAVREFVLTAYRKRSPDDFAETTRRVGSWFERRGHTSESLAVAIQANDAAAVEALINTHGERLIRNTAFSTYLRAAEFLEREGRVPTPLALALRARATLAEARPSETLELVDEVLRSKGATRVARCHALIAAVRAHQLIGDVDAVTQALGRLRRTTRGLPTVLKAEVALAEADVAMTTRSDLAAADRSVRRAIRLAGRDGAPALALTAAGKRAELAFSRGEVIDAVALFEEVARGLRRIAGSGRLPSALNNLGVAYTRIGAYRKAIRTLEKAEALARELGTPRSSAYIAASRGEAQVAAGEYQSGRETYLRVVELCNSQITDTRLLALSLAGLACACLGVGESGEASIYAGGALALTRKGIGTMERATCEVADARVSAAKGDWTGARSSLMHACAAFEQVGSADSLAEARFRLSQVLFRGGDRRGARDMVQSTWSLVGRSWQVHILAPAVREDPLFAQWALSQGNAPEAFSLLVQQVLSAHQHAERREAGRSLPAIRINTLGDLSVSTGGKKARRDIWGSGQARKLFLGILVQEDGIDRDHAVRELYGNSTYRANSQFHSDLYRVRRALNPSNVIRRKDSYFLHPDISFEWDTPAFEQTLSAARRSAAALGERIAALENAMAPVQYEELARAI